MGFKSWAYALHGGGPRFDLQHHMIPDPQAREVSLAQHCLSKQLKYLEEMKNFRFHQDM